MQRRIDNFFTTKNFESAITSDSTDTVTKDDSSVQSLEIQTSSNNDFACSVTSSPNIYGPSYTDIGTLTKENLRKDDDVILKLLTTKWEDPKFQFPTRTLRGRNGRACQLSWLIDNPWLKYSVSLDALYCAPCVFFGSQRSDTKEKKFGFQSPCTDWINVGRSINRQLQQGSKHHEYVMSSEEFICIRSGKSQDILQSLSTSYNQVVTKNRNILKSIIEVILLCGKQNLALRDHAEKDSNFIAILHDKAKGNEILANHLAFCDPRTKCTSPDIQNEIIMLCADQIQSDIVARCNSSRYFAFLADEATDCCTKTIISLCVRFYDRMDKLIHEDFLGFVEGKKTTGEALSDIFLTQLEKYGIIIANMRAQGYNGAPNMSGIHRGVQARVRERVPLASYVHCKPHNLNVAIVHACKEPLVRNLMDTVQAIAFAFDYSAKRLTSFKENLGTAPNVVKEEMGRRQNLKTLCETRWASRSDSLFTFLHAYSVVCDSLEDLEQDGDAKARSYRCSITKFDFIVGLVVAQAILQPLAPLSAILQTKDFDLIQAVEESKVVVEMLQRKRESDDDWDQLYNSAVTLADSVDVVPSMPRGATRQQHRVNVPAAGPKDYWKRALFIPFIDHLLQELRDRLIKNEDRFVVQYLIPSKLENCSLQVVDRLFNTLTEDLPSDRDTFNIEVERWKARWSIAEGQIPGTLAEILNLCNVDLYPNIYTCLLILLTIPVTTATAERSFSVMRRVKTYLRSTMTTDRLSGPCILHAYKETPIDIDKVIDCFATKKDRRLAFLFKATGERE